MSESDATLTATADIPVADNENAPAAGRRGLSTPHVAAPAAMGGMPQDLSSAVIAMAGHDLRQPLQVIIAAHDFLARSLSGGEGQIQLARIEGAAKQLAGTLDRLVETLHLQDAAAQDHRRPVSLRPILTGLWSELV